MNSINSTNSNQLIGGSGSGRSIMMRRTWELPNLPTSDEWLQKNQRGIMYGDGSLLPIIAMSEKTDVRLRSDLRQPSKKLWKYFYYHFMRIESLHFQTMNYAMMLFWMYYNQLTGPLPHNLESIAVTLLYMTSKFTEYEGYDLYGSFRVKDIKEHLDLELQILKTLNYQLPMPIIICKEAMLYKEYFDMVYSGKYTLGQSLYQQAFLLQLVSNMVYTDYNLVMLPKKHLISLILSLFFKNYNVTIPDAKKRLDKVISEFNWFNRKRIKMNY
jgi:hypothetical protein